MGAGAIKYFFHPSHAGEDRLNVYADSSVSAAKPGKAVSLIEKREAPPRYVKKRLARNIDSINKRKGKIPILRYFI